MSDGLYTPERRAASGGAPAGERPDDPLLADLNPGQREAVTAPPGPLLVVAGAGTGKTRVLTRRVAWRIAQGASPHHVLAITFTNKAADVLKERLRATPGGEGVVAGTFHRWCALLLRRYADRIGGTPSFSILDADDQVRLLRDLIDDAGLSTASFRPETFAAVLSHRKSGGAGRPPAALKDPAFRAVYDGVAAAYARRLRASGLYDFDDLLLEAERLLREVDDVRDEVRRRHRHVLVDEYQDTNPTQLSLLKALVGGERPDLTVVGDPDQSIYRWRGATVRNILEFPALFPGARVVKLEECYRSTQRIVAAAEAVIARNAERFDKRLFTHNDLGPPLLDLRARDPVEEGRQVAALLARWQGEGMSPSSLAVFVRVNHASRAIETALRNAEIPYAMVSGVEFFQRREVKDVLAWARLVANPRDEVAFVRALGAPRRGVGAVTLTRLRDAATARGVSLPEAAEEGVKGLSKQAGAALAAFFAVVRDLRARPRSPVGPFFQAIAEASGYREALQRVEDPIERSRVENVDELVAAAHEADRLDPSADLTAFLERATLVSEQDGYAADAARVSLMTVHAAKGLEFDGVVVCGAEDGWFPHARSLGFPEEIEEERRLFYVALTRARRRLALTHAMQRETWNGPERRLPSRFLLDIPDELVTARDGSGTYARTRARAELAGKTSSPWSDAARGRRADGDDADASGGADDLAGAGAPAVGGARREARPADEPTIPRGEGPLQAGERVLHPYFGEGVVTIASGEGLGRRLTVAFAEAGTRTILASLGSLARAPSPRDPADRSPPSTSSEPPGPPEGAGERP